MKYKCLTLTQPWATLIALQAKRIETRSWATKHRGPLLIHAARGLESIGGPMGLAMLCAKAPFSDVLIQHGVTLPDLPRGAIVAVCRLVSIHRITEAGIEGFRPQPPANEIAFGNYAPGRFAWLLTDIHALPRPIPAQGKLGLWEWEGELPL